MNQLCYLATVTPPPSPLKAPEKPSGFGPEFFVVMAIVILGFMFLIQRPQKKDQEERQKALEGIKKNDRVVSAGGIHGVVAKVNKGKGTVHVKVAPGIEIEFNKTALTVQTEEKKEDGKPEVEETSAETEKAKS